MGAVSEIASNVLLFFLVFGMSATVDVDKMRKQLRNRKALFIGVSWQFFLGPLVGFSIVKIMRYSAPIGISLLVVTSSPGGSYSNWWCSMFNAELALSVTMTALSTMLSVIMLPINLTIYTAVDYSGAVVKSLKWEALFMSLFVVIGAICGGLLLSAMNKDDPIKLHTIQRRANLGGNAAGLTLITLSIFVSSSDHKAALWDQDWKFLVGVAIPAVIGIIYATFAATGFQLEKPERIAAAVESSYQNTGIATSVALTMFDKSKDDLATAISVPLYYGLCEAILLAIYCVAAWKAGWTKAPPDENFCRMLATTYEVEEQRQTEEPQSSIEVVLPAGVNNCPNGDADHTEIEENLSSDWPQDLVLEVSDEGQGPKRDDSSRAVNLRKLDEEGEGDRPEHNVVSQDDAARAAHTLSHHDNGLDNSYSSHGRVGRFGRTVSLMKAMVTGYKKAPEPEPASLPTSPRDALDDEEEGVEIEQYAGSDELEHPDGISSLDVESAEESKRPHGEDDDAAQQSNPAVGHTID